MPAFPSSRHRILRWVAAVLVAGLVLLATYLVWAHEPEIPQMTPLATSAVPPKLAARGAELAHLGDCVGCHTVTAFAPYSGGKALKTPFGSLYGPNLTPDPQTGLGRWPFTAFRRAVQQGVARDGQHLYPGLPYDHFANLKGDDVAALYAYLMTLPPVHAQAPDNRLIPPANFRPFLAAWKLLSLHPNKVMPPLSPDPVWNRGAYLAEALAHCGACHSPRNLLQAERHDRPLGGGWADGWTTPPLDGSNKRWNAHQLETYLVSGRAPDGSHARGPMAMVVESLRASPRADVHAIAVYVAARMNGDRLGWPAR